MRSLARDEQTIRYKLYVESHKVYLTDAEGHIQYTNVNGVSTPIEIGTSEATYGDMQSMDINVSGSKGETENTVFGKQLEYERVMTTHDMACQIDESTHLWIDVATDKEHDYEVKKRAPVKNCIVYAIKKA